MKLGNVSGIISIQENFGILEHVKTGFKGAHQINR